MKRMRPVSKIVRAWVPRAPRWTAVLLAALIAMDAAHFVLVFGAEARAATHPQSGVPRSATSRLAGLELRQIARAHLFGVDPAAVHGVAASGTQMQPHLALSGVVATSDPDDGYAILGEQGQATRLYRTGAALANGGTLYRVFTDHVLLDLDGRRETLRLPRQSLNTSAPVRSVRLDAPVAAGAAIPTLISERTEAPSAAEGWFSNLYAERYTVDGRTGLRLHPAKHFQRHYGLRDGDTLTAVNGVPAADEDAVDSSLRAGGKSVALTLTRDGVEETVRFPVEQ